MRSRVLLSSHCTAMLMFSGTPPQLGGENRQETPTGDVAINDQQIDDGPSHGEADTYWRRNPVNQIVGGLRQEKGQAWAFRYPFEALIGG